MEELGWRIAVGIGLAVYAALMIAAFHIETDPNEVGKVAAGGLVLVIFLVGFLRAVWWVVTGK